LIRISRYDYIHYGKLLRLEKSFISKYRSGSDREKKNAPLFTKVKNAEAKKSTTRHNHFVS
jgi:hypothetical protein